MEGRNGNTEDKSVQTEKTRKIEEKEEEEKEEMVAIALYRGNLHRVPNTPRRWNAPPRTLSASQFKSLLRRRSLALSGGFCSKSAPASYEKQEEKEDVIEKEGEKEKEEKAVPVPVLKEEKQEEEEEEEEGELADPDCALPIHTQDDKPSSDQDLTVKQEQFSGCYYCFGGRINRHGREKKGTGEEIGGAEPKEA